MLAGRETGSSTLLALAQTLKVDALTDTGAADNGIFTTSNGTDWFNADNWSFGFKPVGVAFQKYQCAFAPSDYSMCLHTLSGIGGYSINTQAGLFGNNYEKLVFSASDVPEPSVWAMLIAGFGLVGAASRRRRMVVA